MIPEKFPWYDSYWLAIYLYTKDFIEKTIRKKPRSSCARLMYSER